MVRWKLGKGGKEQQPYDDTNGQYLTLEVMVGDTATESFEEYRDAVLSQNGYSDEYKTMDQDKKGAVDSYLKAEYRKELSKVMDEMNKKETGSLEFYGVENSKRMLSELLPKIITKDFVETVEERGVVFKNKGSGAKFEIFTVPWLIQKARFGTNHFSTCSKEEYEDIDINMPYIGDNEGISAKDVMALVKSGCDFTVHRGLPSDDADECVKGFYDSKVTDGIQGSGDYGHVIYTSLSHEYARDFASGFYDKESVLLGCVVRNNGNLKVWDLNSQNTGTVFSYELLEAAGITINDIKTAVEDCFAAAGKSISSSAYDIIVNAMSTDPGTIAALLGYDAIYGYYSQFDIVNPSIVDVVPENLY
jgi:hypothetical protein